jgi:hypothetical protein
MVFSRKERLKVEDKEDKAQFKDKLKASYYIDPKTEERLLEISLKRAREGKRTRKSQIIDEAVELFHKQESIKAIKH